MTMGKTKKKDHRSASLTRRQSTREVKQSFLIVCEAGLFQGLQNDRRHGKGGRPGNEHDQSCEQGH